MYACNAFFFNFTATALFQGRGGGKFACAMAVVMKINY